MNNQVPLLQENLKPDPIEQFALWYTEFQKIDWIEPSSVGLATIHKGQPTIRTVLLKGFDKKGFVFFTNYKSQKSKDISKNPKVALLFYWPPLGRQVRVEGVAKKTSKKESDDYFATRALDSQLGAWASDQSEEIPGREFLIEKLNMYRDKFNGKTVPRPSHWRGFRVQPTLIEFWQSREARLHDRFVYTKKGTKWNTHRISP